MLEADTFWMEGMRTTKPMQENHAVHTALLLGSTVCAVIALDTVQKLLSELGVPNVVNVEVDTLLNVTVPDDFVYDLVHDHTDGVRCDVVHDASLSGWPCQN